ncbi:MAG: sigma-70 family RNA polymerase sigma factor, partial [Vicingaceae bacterium]|nr:sigma-70 family RNA polymerase sigma factor [Vicingaceae bacterium]
NINDFEGKSKLKTWVYSIAHHEVLNYLRKNKIPTTELMESIPIVDNEKNILDTFADKDMKLMIEHFFNQLPADQKELLILFYLNELSLKEIEAVTALSAANIRVKLFRARENFKNLLSEKDITLLNQIRYE